jgi:hypothetical protein
MNKRGLYKRLEAEKLWLPRKAEILWLYNEQSWSHAQIGEYYGVSQTTISKVFRRIGIKSRGHANFGARNGRYKDGSQSRLYRQMIEKDKCEKCETTEKLGVHHRDGDHFNNKLANLCVLCGSCHSSYHKKLWWNKQDKSKIKRDRTGKFKWVIKETWVCERHFTREIAL